MRNPYNSLPRYDLGGAVSRWAIGDESLMDILQENVTSRFDSTAGKIGSGLATGGLYAVPILGQALALDDFAHQARKMINSKNGNSLGDWAELGMTGLFAVPVLGGLAKMAKLSSLGKGLEGLHNVTLQGKTWKGTLGKNAGLLGTTAVAKMVSPSVASSEKLYNHYGKMMTAEEIKKDNMLRNSENQKLNALRQAILNGIA